MLIRIEMPGEELKEALRPVLALVGNREEYPAYVEALCVKAHDNAIEFMTTDGRQLMRVTLPVAERMDISVDAVFTGAAAQPLIKAINALKKGEGAVSLVFNYGDVRDGCNAGDATLQLKTATTETTIRNRLEGRVPNAEALLKSFKPIELSEFYVDIRRVKNILDAFGRRIVHVSISQDLLKIVPKIAENDAYPAKTVALLALCDK